MTDKERAERLQRATDSLKTKDAADELLQKLDEFLDLTDAMIVQAQIHYWAFHKLETDKGKISVANLLGLARIVEGNAYRRPT